MINNHFDRQHQRTKRKLFAIGLLLLAIALLLAYDTYADSPAELPAHATLLPLVVSPDSPSTCNTQYANAMPIFTQVHIDSLPDSPQARYLTIMGITYVYVACDNYGLYTAIVGDAIDIDELVIGIFIGRGESAVDAIDALAMDHLVRTNATYIDGDNSKRIVAATPRRNRDN